MGFNASENQQDLPDDGSLTLVRTRLRAGSGELRRMNSDGGLLLRIPLSEVESVGLAMRFNPEGLAFIGMGLGSAAIAMFVSDNIILTTFLYIAAVAFVFWLGAFTIYSRTIIIRTRDGDTAIECEDLRDECECFVIGVRQLLNRQSTPAPRRDDTSSSTAFSP